MYIYIMFESCLMKALILLVLNFLPIHLSLYIPGQIINRLKNLSGYIQNNKFDYLN
jgi:hypothetical protein